jgi:hypothetical protein
MLTLLLCVDAILVCSSAKTVMPLAQAVLGFVMNTSLVAIVHLRLGFISC